ncbi:MAG: hypothetical protein ACM30E_00865 [Nitrososphaerales archaeon]
MTTFYIDADNELHREAGQTMPEYALLLALVALLVIAAVLLLGAQIAAVLLRLASSLSGG